MTSQNKQNGKMPVGGLSEGKHSTGEQPKQRWWHDAFWSAWNNPQGEGVKRHDRVTDLVDWVEHEATKRAYQRVREGLKKMQEHQVDMDKYDKVEFSEAQATFYDVMELLISLEKDLL